MRNTLAESPSGLVHLAHLLESGRIITACGREVNHSTWTRIRSLDGKLGGMSRSSIAKMVEMPKCDRCLG